MTAGLGGGVTNGNGAIAISDSTITNNSGANVGGGIRTGSGAITITNANISNNRSAGQGGGIGTGAGAISVTNSTIARNSSTSQGGGISNVAGSITVTNTTISGNTSDQGGGIRNNTGAVTLNNATLINNSGATTSGGIALPNGAGVATVTNSIVAGNRRGSAESDVGGAGTFNGSNNIIGSVADLTTGNIGDVANNNRVLGPSLIPLSAVLNTTLADNGNRNQTHALVANSIAINAAGAGATTADQRSFGAVGIRDIGALRRDLRILGLWEFGGDRQWGHHSRHRR